MAQQIQDMTPVEIDTELSKLWNQEAEAEARVKNYVLALHKAVGDEPRRVRGTGGVVVSFSPEKVWELAIIKAKAPYTETESYAAREIDRTLTGWAMAKRKLEDLAAEIRPYTDEYSRRGGWNRVFLATSTGGHAHNGQNCSTCHHGESRTGFAWLIQYSGKTQDEIVADAGERACTTCYPTAPVNAKGTKMFTPDEVEAQKARDERAIQQAKKAREADAKSITTPEGEKLYAGRDNGSWDVCKTLRAAEIAATDALMDLLLEQRTSQDPEHAWVYEQGKNTDLIQMRIARHAWCLIRSIAAKKDQTFEETFEVHEKKAQAKLRKLDRAWAKDFRNPNHVK